MGCWWGKCMCWILCFSITFSHFSGIHSWSSWYSFATGLFRNRSFAVVVRKSRGVLCGSGGVFCGKRSAEIRLADHSYYTLFFFLNIWVLIQLLGLNIPVGTFFSLICSVGMYQKKAEGSWLILAWLFLSVPVNYKKD